MQMGAGFEAVVGKKGLGWGRGRHDAHRLAVNSADPIKYEGDLKAPAGVFDLVESFGYAPDGQAKTPFFPYTGVGDFSRCVDDPNSSHYNANIYDLRKVEVDWKSAEELRRPDEFYEWAIVVDHNGFGGGSARRAGSGSCIFLHLWRGLKSHTAGCTAFSLTEMLRVLEWIDERRAPRLVQLTRADYERYREAWQLP
jgi:D-alanyl-D-alanine dipeptidase